MYTPKSDIFNILSTLKYEVSQDSDNVFNTLPVITFSVGNNNVNLDLNNEILYQDIEININIWAETSVMASTMLREVEALMRQHGYKLTFSGDIPQENGIYHISNRFKTIK